MILLEKNSVNHIKAVNDLLKHNERTLLHMFGNFALKFACNEKHEPLHQSDKIA